MRIRVLAILASVLTISIGTLVLLGLLLPDNLSGYEGFVDITQDFAGVMLDLVTITVALTVLIGIINLLSVHIGKLFSRRREAVYSLVLLLSFAGVIAATILDRETGDILLETVQFSVESALAGLLFFALVYGAYRMLRDQVTWAGVLFIAVLLVVLVGALPFTELDVLQDTRDWLLEIPVSAGARGLLLGIALATVVTGVRVLIGTDRSYRE